MNDIENSNAAFSWGHNRRYNAVSNSVKKEFGGRVQKLSVNAGFTCPNRDGAISKGGCSYCNNRSFSPSYCKSETSIREQLARGVDFHEDRYRNATSYFAYFQSYSNTYDTVDVLREKYQEALSVDKVNGLIIGTRPDCLPDDVIKLLQQLAGEYHVVVELGIESVYNETLDRINRGHSFEQTIDAFNRLHKAGIRSGGHLIFGLPGETRQMMLDSATIISKLPIHSIKFHQLQIIEGTIMEQEFMEQPETFKLFELDEYLDFICEYLTRLRSDIVIERLAGESPPTRNLGKHWNIRYDQVVQRVEKMLEEKNWWQGMRYAIKKN
ncbi:MAG: TIGR01212 family radical SAM protein [Bacteroidales bacterium]|nr:TIGR01212 family radical SAM protein [Bacteroidales bacterium]